MFKSLEKGATDVEEARIDVANAKIDSICRILSHDIKEREELEEQILKLETKADALATARNQRRLLEFKAQFLQEAIRLRAELSQRSGRPVGGVDDPTSDLLDNGKFSFELLDMLINYLNEMASRLPD